MNCRDFVKQFEKPTEKLGIFLISKKNKATHSEIPITEILYNTTNENFKYFKILNNKESNFSGNNFIELVIEYASKIEVLKTVILVVFLLKTTVIMQIIIYFANDYERKYLGCGHGCG